MSHIVESCPLTKLNGGQSQLHSADDTVTCIAYIVDQLGLNRIRKKKKRRGS